MPTGHYEVYQDNTVKKDPFSLLDIDGELPIGGLNFVELNSPETAKIADGGCRELEFKTIVL
jgi:hypothetical protein